MSANPYVCTQCGVLSEQLETLMETNTRLNRRVTKAEGIVLARAREEWAAGRSLGRALANAACSALRAENERLLARECCCKPAEQDDEDSRGGI